MCVMILVIINLCSVVVMITINMSINIIVYIYICSYYMSIHMLPIAYCLLSIAYRLLHNAHVPDPSRPRLGPPAVFPGPASTNGQGQGPGPSSWHRRLQIGSMQ